ncbi:hypothetical protein GQ44DRAFT_731304 [Phaeosphaeriaceae sp. PMI808]|nr:hypothetical protein GQ44DRAFT_731304 [Phaeosphaeriaceae sp. PMI808]
MANGSGEPSHQRVDAKVPDTPPESSYWFPLWRSHKVSGSTGAGSAVTPTATAEVNDKKVEEKYEKSTNILEKEIEDGRKKEAPLPQNTPREPTPFLPESSISSLQCLEAYILQARVETFPGFVKLSYDKIEYLHLDQDACSIQEMKIAYRDSVFDTISTIHPEQLNLILEHTKARCGQLVGVQPGMPATVALPMGTLMTKPVIFLIRTAELPEMEKPDKGKALIPQTSRPASTIMPLKGGLFGTIRGFAPHTTGNSLFAPNPPNSLFGANSKTVPTRQESTPSVTQPGDNQLSCIKAASSGGHFSNGSNTLKLDAFKFGALNTTAPNPWNLSSKSSEPQATAKIDDRPTASISSSTKPVSQNAITSQLPSKNKGKARADVAVAPVTDKLENINFGTKPSVATATQVSQHANKAQSQPWECKKCFRNLVFHPTAEQAAGLCDVCKGNRKTSCWLCESIFEERERQETSPAPLAETTTVFQSMIENVGPIKATTTKSEPKPDETKDVDKPVVPTSKKGRRAARRKLLKNQSHA